MSQVNYQTLKHSSAPVLQYTEMQPFITKLNHTTTLEIYEEMYEHWALRNFQEKHIIYL